MLGKATLTIDLAKIQDNARMVVEALPGVEIVGVTKVTCGTPEIARAMLAGGVSALGESRLENLERLRHAGITAPLWLLRSPTPARAEQALRLADVALVSEIDIVAALDGAAKRADTTFRVVVMIDVGDLREGMMPAMLPEFLERVSAFSSIEVHGIGISLTCYGAIIPTAENLGELAGLAEMAERLTGRPLIAPVIESMVKPSRPKGICAQDAFGNRPVFDDLGDRRRAICSIGRQDVVPEQLTPLDEHIKVLGASSDHLILDVHDLPDPPKVGDMIAFRPGYSATLALFTSAYVCKEFTGGN